MPTAGTTL